MSFLSRVEDSFLLKQVSKQDLASSARWEIDPSPPLVDQDDNSKKQKEGKWRSRGGV